MKSATQLKPPWHEETEEASDAADLPATSDIERERWRRGDHRDELEIVQHEIGLLKARLQSDQRQIQEFGEELRSLRALVTPPAAVSSSDPHYEWAISHQDEVRRYAGEWIGVTATQGGIVAHGPKMIDVRNLLRESALLHDSYIIFVPAS